MLLKFLNGYSRNDSEFYILKINWFLTGFFGGTNNRQAITTFDWTTMEYTSHSPQLFGNRGVQTSCALVNGQNGEKLVAVATGGTAGMEAWNPIDETVKYLTVDFPIKTMSGQMFSVLGGDQLLLYSSTEIWNYNQANNTWIKIGNMLQDRRFFVALPVKNISCQQVL